MVYLLALEELDYTARMQHVYCTVSIDRFRVGTLTDGGAFTALLDVGSRADAIAMVAHLNGGLGFTTQRELQLIPEYLENGQGGVIISPRAPTPV